MVRLLAPLARMQQEMKKQLGVQCPDDDTHCLLFFRCVSASTYVYDRDGSNAA